MLDILVCEMGGDLIATFEDVRRPGKDWDLRKVMIGAALHARAERRCRYYAVVAVDPEDGGEVAGSIAVNDVIFEMGSKALRQAFWEAFQEATKR